MQLSKRHVKDLVSLVVIAFVVFSGRSSLADHYHVPSGSMLPTLEIGDRVIVDKTAFGLRIPFTSVYLTEVTHPERGDVVILSSPRDGTTLIKRIVGMPGDAIAVRKGRLFLGEKTVPVMKNEDGITERLSDNAHAIRLTHGGGRDFGPMQIPAGQFLVLGDNRGDSLDGRYFGLVSFELLKGRAERIYFRDGSFAWVDL